MGNIKDTAKNIIGKKLLIFILCFMTLLFFCGFNAPQSFAADDYGITVSDARSGKTVTGSELKRIALDEGSKEYNFSAFKHTDTYDPVKAAGGPTVAGVFESAGIDPAGISDNTIIKLTAVDGAVFKVTAKQLFRDERYWYPKSETLPLDGTIGGDWAFNGKVKTPAIINLDDERKTGTFCIAQITPNEKNKPIFAQYMLGGKITVTSDKAVKATPVTESQLGADNGIEFTIPADEEDSMIYYTVDGSDPAFNGNIYNYYNFNGTVKTKAYKVTKPGDYTVKVVTKHYGKMDSEVKEFAYSFRSFWNQGQPKAKLSKYNEVTVGGFDTDEASGYRVFYKPAETNSWKYKDVTGTLFKLGLSEGKKYDFKVVPYSEAGGKKSFSISSNETSIESLSKVTLKAVKKSKNSISLSWSKIGGCTGYEVYKAVNSGKFKKVKSLSAGKVSLTEKKLAKKKTYKYKVRAYKTESGKKIYAPYSSVKKVKL